MLTRAQLSGKIAALALCAFVVLAAGDAYAVANFRVSQYDGGHQIWFEAEDFDERDANEVYKRGDAEGVLDPEDGAFGDIITNSGGDGWLLYNFDISKAGGSAGEWRFIGRIINPSNASDWLWVLGDDGDEGPEVKPAFVRPDHIIFENDSPVWTWRTDGDFGGDGGTVNELQKGENTMMIWTRGSNLTDQYDVFLWADDLLFAPTDDDYINAEEKNALDVQAEGKLTTTWADLRR